MIIPIYGYGEAVLRKVGENITPEYPNLNQVITNMYDTMYNANGVGLAAPQVGLAIRLFVIDTTPFSDSDDITLEEAAQLKDFRKTFINAKILKEEGEMWTFNEGCLSIPDVREDVSRHDTVTIEYLDENFKSHTETYNGLIARVIQHEYDHIEGILFTDKISSLKKKTNAKRMQNIMEGKAKPDYRMKFAGIKSK
jgi:peptide deformylase